MNALSRFYLRYGVLWLTGIVFSSVPFSIQAFSVPEAYVAIPIKKAGSSYTEAAALNDKGQVVGYYRNERNMNRAFVTGYNGIGMKDIGVLSGYGTHHSSAYAINSKGQVTGHSGALDEAGGGVNRGFITDGDGGGMRSIGAAGAGVGSFGRDINDEGVIVGIMQYGHLLSRALMTQANGTNVEDVGTLMPDPGNNSSLLKINNKGQAVGMYSITRNGPGRPFFMDEDRNIYFYENVIGMILGSPIDINNKGVVVGEYYVNGFYMHGYLIDENMRMVDLGRCPIYGINDDGLILTGMTVPNSSLGLAAATYGRCADSVDLNTRVTNLPKGEILSWGVAVNNSGQILTRAYGTNNYYLLTPVDASSGIQISGGLVITPIVQDGYIGAMQLSVRLNVPVAGDYSATFTMTDSSGKEIEQFEWSAHLDAGENAITVTVDAEEVRHYDGPYNVESLIVTGPTGIAVIDRLQDPVFYSRWQYHPGAQPADLNGDGVADREDYDLLLSFRNQPPYSPGDRRDLNRDGKIDLIDFRIMQSWLN